MCVVPGHALRLPVRYLGEAILARPAVRELIAEVTQSAMVQLMQNVMCEKIHALPARCARILMELTHTLGSVFELTHEELAALLSATRPSTTRVMNWLAADAIIEYARGTIRVLDLAALEARSCGCYGTLLARRQRLLRLVSPGRPDHHHDVGPAARASRAVAGARP